MRRRPRCNPASACGLGGSNSIDDLVLRPVLDKRDANTDWNDDASDGTGEERIYSPSGGCQNWRHDVVALVTSGGALRERVRYTAYGIPVGMPHSYGWRDCDGDGDVDAADQSILLGAWGTNTPKCDLNLDGTVDAADNAILLGQLGATAGFGRLSLSGNRFGYAGYASDPAVHADWHVRHRVLMSGLGRWSRRDPLTSRDWSSLYLVLDARPIHLMDSLGLSASPVAWAQAQTVLKREEPCRLGMCAWRFFGFSPGTERCTPAWVQKVTVKASCADCTGSAGQTSCPPTGPATEQSYWELFDDRGATVIATGPQGAVFGSGWFDQGGYRPGLPCGQYDQRGEVRFYCREWFYASGRPASDPFQDWTSVVIPHAPCGTTDSGDTPATSMEPSWWQSPWGRMRGGRSAHRGVVVSWDCCACQALSVKCSPEVGSYDPESP